MAVLAMVACGPACSGCLCVLLFSRHIVSAQPCHRCRPVILPCPFCVQGRTGNCEQPVDCGLLGLGELLQNLCSQAAAAPPGAEQQRGAAATVIAAPCIVPPSPGLAGYELIAHFDRAAQQLAATAMFLAAAAAERQQVAADSAEPAQAAAASAGLELAVRRARALALRSCAKPALQQPERGQRGRSEGA